jgi:(p)ppGpp synthase/HD superfamily hydrolase
MFATTRRKKTRIPYVAHLLGVCAIVLEHGGSEDEAIAALLHDTLEDITPTNQARSTVRAFGDDVYGIVEGCTDGMPNRKGRKAVGIGNPDPITRRRRDTRGSAHRADPVGERRAD